MISKIEYANKQSYEGETVDNQRSGKGTFYYGDGTKLDASWIDGLPDGDSKFTDNKGKVSEFVWKMGVRKNSRATKNIKFKQPVTLEEQKAREEDTASMDLLVEYVEMKSQPSKKFMQKVEQYFKLEKAVNK